MPTRRSHIAAGNGSARRGGKMTTSSMPRRRRSICSEQHQPRWRGRLPSRSQMRSAGGSCGRFRKLSRARGVDLCRRHTPARKKLGGKFRRRGPAGQASPMSMPSRSGPPSFARLTFVSRYFRTEQRWISRERCARRRGCHSPKSSSRRAPKLRRNRVFWRRRHRVGIGLGRWRRRHCRSRERPSSSAAEPRHHLAPPNGAGHFIFDT